VLPEGEHDSSYRRHTAAAREGRRAEGLRADRCTGGPILRPAEGGSWHPTSWLSPVGDNLSFQSDGDPLGGDTNV
jgi:hypothetical protein